MEVLSDYELPPLEQPIAALPEKQASEKAFYTSAVAENNEDPISTYQEVKSDLMQTGASKALVIAEQRWVDEQDSFGKEFFTDMIQNPNIDMKLKRDALTIYANNGYISKSLRDEYIEKVASKGGALISDNKAQDEYNKSLSQRLSKINFDLLNEDINKANEDPSFSQYAEAFYEVGKDVGTSIPTSLIGAVYAITQWSAVDGQELANELLTSWRDNPTDPTVNAIREKIFDKLKFLEIPYAKTMEFTYKLTGSEDAAILAGLAAEGGVGSLAYKGFKAGAKKAFKKSKPKIPTGSPLDTTLAANTTMAADLGKAAVNDTTGELAKALGATRGEIIGDLAYPSAVNENVNGQWAEFKPTIDLYREDLAKTTEELAALVEDSRWDPSIHNVELRRKEQEIVYKVISQERTPVYQSANSSIAPTALGTWNGYARFGPTKTTAYSSVEDVVTAAKGIRTDLTKTPNLGELSTVNIVDTVTGKRYNTPKELLDDPKFKTTLENLPEKTDGGIPIKYGPTGKTRTDGSKVNATLKKDDKGNALEIAIDADAIRASFDSKPWANPKVEGVVPFRRDAFKTAEEYLHFVIAHEEARIKYKNNGAMSKSEYENFINQRALDEMDAIRDKYNLDKPTAPIQLVVEWAWERKYDDLSINNFGPNAVKTKIFGVNTNTARGVLSQYLFGGRGIFPKWFEMASARQSIRAARQASRVMQIISKKIAKTDFPEELLSLIDKAETDAIEFFPLSLLQTSFPHLSKAQVVELQATHNLWRRITHFQHALVNMQHRNDLISEGYSKGLYEGDKYLGPATDTPIFDDKNRMPYKVWDMDLKQEVVFQLKTTIDPKPLNTVISDKPAGIRDVGGKKLVRVRTPIRDNKDSLTDDSVYEYVLIDESKNRIDNLPEQVVPRTSGYSPIKTKAYWFIEKTPTALMVNGSPLTSPDGLAKYSEVVAVANSELEANKISDNLLEENPGLAYKPRPDREIDVERDIKIQEVHNSILRQSMKRGESLGGTVEDRLLSLINTTKSVINRGSLQAWEEATQRAFVNAYGDYLVNGEYPTTINSFINRPGMSRDEVKQLQNAKTIFEQHQKIRAFSTMEDRAWAKTFNWVADIFEKTPWSAKYLMPGTREIGKGNTIFEGARKVASTLYIALNPQRQFIVQTGPLMEMLALNPLKAPKRIAELLAVRLAILADAPLLKNSGVNFNKVASDMSNGISQDIVDLKTAILKSGLLESIDLNLLVHGIADDLDRGLKEGTWEKYYKNTIAVPKGATKVVRSLGFGAAESLNSIGLWIIARDKWVDRNPGKDWRSDTAINEISYDQNNMSGAMTRAGSFPYQSGAFGLLMQFGAITQKLTMNLIQSGTTVLTVGERARLAVTRALLFGAREGLPFGALAYWYLDQTKDKEVLKVKEELRRGLYDRGMNHLLMALTDSEHSDLYAVKGITPYGESTTGIPYVELIREVMKAVDDKPSDPRFPVVGAIGSIFKAKDNIKGWFTTRDVKDESIALQVTMEALTLASGMNNWAKSQLLLSHKDKMNKYGAPMGLNASKAEAYGQFFGMITYREQSQMDSFGGEMDKEKAIKDMAKEIYLQIQNQRKIGGDTHLERMQMVGSFLNELIDGKRWVDEDRTKIWDEVWKLDGTAITTPENSLATMVGKDLASADAETQRTINHLRIYSKNPETHRYLDILEGKEEQP
jgi:hypothetical protein